MKLWMWGRIAGKVSHSLWFGEERKRLKLSQDAAQGCSSGRAFSTGQELLAEVGFAPSDFGNAWMGQAEE